MRRWPRDQKSKPEVNSRDVISYRSEAYVRRSRWLFVFCTKFGTEHKYQFINTPEWPNSHNLKIQDGGVRHFEFRKKINNFGLDKYILHQIIWEDAPWLCGDDHVTKNRNRKLIRVTSSNECLKHYVRRSRWLYLCSVPNLVQNTNTNLSTRRNGQIRII